jgi:hypothetical protein
MDRKTTLISAAAVAAVFGLAGIAQAETFNIWTASKADSQLQTVQHGGGRRSGDHPGYERDRNWWPGAAPGAAAGVAVGAAATGAAIATGRNAYVEGEDPYAGTAGQRDYIERDCERYGRPSHYPVMVGC